ncbi:MAG: ferrochelatase [Rhodospirillales bacterium]|nr:ferrochelatase [Rhodospirillales bacterium]
MPAKTAVVLFNLGGPDGPAAIQPFLFNLFNDPAIIGLPGPFRWLLAKLLARRRAPVAREIYGHLGGGSPLPALTREQAAALEAELNASGPDEYRAFVAMRYWHPFAHETAAEVEAFGPDRVVLLPLYPQFSTTTTGSSIADWYSAAEKRGIAAETRAICCYPLADGWIAAQADLLKRKLAEAGDAGPRVLFSAHGLPKKVVDKGDPYQWQVEQTAEKLAGAVGLGPEDWRVCYQSRVGPLEWLAPSLDEELERAAADETGVAVLPIAFVSEHSETLVELDIEYAARARELKLPRYVRVPAVGTHPEFISALAHQVRDPAQRGDGPAPADGVRLCPEDRRKCPCRPRESMRNLP